MNMNMRKLLIVFAALTGCALTAAAPAATKVISLELGIEASTDATTLPASNTGTVVMNCATCTARSYRVTPQTTYFIGANSVTLAQLNAFVSTGGTPYLTIFVKPDESAVQRVLPGAHVVPHRPPRRRGGRYVPHLPYLRRVRRRARDARPRSHLITRDDQLPPPPCGFF